MNSQRSLRCCHPLHAFSVLTVLALALAFLPAGVQAQEEAVDICLSGCRYSSIQQAVNAAGSGTTLRIGAGTYRETVTLRAGVSLIGAGSGSTIINGNGSQSVMTAANSGIQRSTVIDGLSITGGGGANGGGVLVRGGAAPTLRNLVVYGNSATGWGGGVGVSEGSNPLLENLTVRNNSAPTGAGLALGSQSRATVRNSRFENNTSTGSRSAGAISVVGASSLTMQDGIVRGEQQREFAGRGPPGRRRYGGN